MFQISPARRLRVAEHKNSKQNKMKDTNSGQPKAKKKKTEKGSEKRWWYVEFFFLYHVCVCHLPYCQTTAAIKIMRNRFVTFNWLAFFRFHDRLTQNYELKSEEKISFDEILEVKLALN